MISDAYSSLRPILTRHGMYLLDCSVKKFASCCHYLESNIMVIKRGDNKIDHTNKGRRKTDLLAFLSDEHKRYCAEILPLHPDTEHGSDNGFEIFDIAKEDFLESLWDVICQHFDDKGALCEIV